MGTINYDVCDHEKETLTFNEIEELINCSGKIFRIE